jgi:hypothetical protein
MTIAAAVGGILLACGLAAPASAAPVNPSAISPAAATPSAGELQQVHYRRYRHCHGPRWNRWCHGARRWRGSGPGINLYIGPGNKYGNRRNWNNRGDYRRNRRDN